MTLQLNLIKNYKLNIILISIGLYHTESCIKMGKITIVFKLVR